LPGMRAFAITPAMSPSTIQLMTPTGASVRLSS
jgi:hypothetical protein